MGLFKIYLFHCTMVPRLVIDKSVYVLVGSLLVGLLIFSGCDRSPEEEEVVSEEVVVEQIESEATFEDEEEVSSDAPFADVEEEPPVEEEATTVETTEPEGSTEEPEDSAYVDGTYTQTGSYQSPAGSESITVTVTVQEDVVTGVSVTSNAVNPTSQNYQGLFISGVNSVVVGKPLSDVGSLGPVNGSSLTPVGFNSALNVIKSEATNAS